MTTKHNFNNKWGFILASVGSAVGMANVWSFPSKLGSNGGGTFLLIYFFFIFIFSYVGLPAEFAVGRYYNTGALGSYKKAWATRGKKAEKVGGIIGYLPLAGSLCIAIGYAVIIAYVLKALVSSIDGTLMSVDATTWFASFSENTYSVLPYHIIIVVITLLTLFLGAKSIEKTNKIMMPLFFIIFLILAVRVAFLPNVLEGYKYIFVPDLNSFFNPMVWIQAMGQAFFSLSIIGSGMVTYGSYLSKKESVLSVSRRTALFDTIAAIIATLVIIPACFSYNLDISAGPSLLFITLPTVFKDIPFGNYFSIILYIAMIFAGISSLQNMLEAVTESITYKFPKLKRKLVLLVLGVICLGIGINIEAIYQWGPWMDIISIYIIPIGATIGAITWFWIMKKDKIIDAINIGSNKLRGNLWYNTGRYIYVLSSIILCAVAFILQISF